MEKEENCVPSVGNENSESINPDGTFLLHQGQTTFNVKVYFDYNSGMTAEDRLKRVIQAESAEKSS